MQNRYVADAGDFGKYLLLKKLCNNDLKLGVNWCLVENENHNNDGKHISYLEKQNSLFHQADGLLFEQLQKIIRQSSRNIYSVEQSDILPKGTHFFSEKIPLQSARIEWHKRSLFGFENSDLVFYDPDNGLEIKSCGINSSKAVKYVFIREIIDTWKKKKSIVIYQHTNRNGTIKDQIKARKLQLEKDLDLSQNQISVIRSNHGTSRFYIVIKQLNHNEKIDQNLKMLNEFPVWKILQLAVE